MTENFSSLSPQQTDTIRILEAKILKVLGGAGGSSTLGAVTSGHGAPSANPGVTAAVYYDLDTGVLYQWNGSAWV